MSHFTVLVIGENPEEQLTPFDENLETPRYVKYTKSSLIEKERKRIEDYKNGTYAKFLADPIGYAQDCTNDSHLEYLKNEFPKKLEMTDDEIYAKAISDYEQDEIGENGEVYSTYNPKSKWDWHQLGGRWAGVLKIKEGVDFKPPNFSWGWDEESKAELLRERRTDSAKKGDITNLEELTTFAILINGEWIERAEMGWFGISYNEQSTSEEWGIKAQELIQGLPAETLLSIYDCHI